MQKFAVQATSGRIAGSFGAKQVRTVPRCSSSMNTLASQARIGMVTAHEIHVSDSTPQRRHVYFTIRQLFLQVARQCSYQPRVHLAAARPQRRALRIQTTVRAQYTKQEKVERSSVLRKGRAAYWRQPNPLT